VGTEVAEGDPACSIKFLCSPDVPGDAGWNDGVIGSSKEKVDTKGLLEVLDSDSTFDLVESLFVRPPQFRRML